jgi:hypothetical protein
MFPPKQFSKTPRSSERLVYFIPGYFSISDPPIVWACQCEEVAPQKRRRQATLPPMNVSCPVIKLDHRTALHELAPHRLVLRRVWNNVRDAAYSSS